MPLLLTAGCSFTKDYHQKTWADYLAENLCYDLKNIAGRGAGIEFIKYRVLHECSQTTPDLVAIMLPSVDRFDLYVDKDHPLNKEFNKISSWQNGQEPSLLDINGNINYVEGFSLTGGEHRGHKKYWYKYYYSETSALLKYWTDVLTLQQFLNLKKIPHVFTMAYDKNHIVEQQINATGQNNSHQFIWNNIDWNKFIFFNTDQGFLSFVRDNKFEIKNNHPVTEAHLSWIEKLVYPHIKTALDQ